jgi:hypothetical protein
MTILSRSTMAGAEGKAPFSFLGSKLLRSAKSAPEATEEVLAGKDYVLLYFSAHW